MPKIHPQNASVWITSSKSDNSGKDLDPTRRRNPIKMMRKFYAKVNSEDATRDEENWDILPSYGTIGSHTRNVKLPHNIAGLENWQRTNLCQINNEGWSKRYNFIRKIPVCAKLPPVFRHHFSPEQEKSHAMVHALYSRIRTPQPTQTKTDFPTIQLKTRNGRNGNHEKHLLYLINESQNKI